MHKVPETPFILRKFEPSDIEPLWAFRNNLEIASGLGGFSTGYSHKDLESWIEFHRGKSDEVLYAIVDRSSNLCVGHVGLYRWDRRVRKADFGILLGMPEYHGRGYGERITRFMIEFGFQQLALNKITLSVVASNKRAASLYEKLGFVREGVARADTWRDGEFLDVVHMSLLRDEWTKP